MASGTSAILSEEEVLQTENEMEEEDRKAQEADKMSTGAGDRRREIEAKLSPDMRSKAATAQRIRAEQIQEQADRRARASVARKYARPVEKVLSVYNSQYTDLFDVLQVRKHVNDVTLKKAYRRLALMVHPGITALLHG